MTLHLKNHRQRFGISQHQLAELIGVNQSTVSRWERGIDEISRRHKLELNELFTNRRGVLDPAIRKMLEFHPLAAAADMRSNLLYLTNQTAWLAARRRPSDMVGTNIRRWSRASWTSKVYRGVDLSEIIMIDYTHAFDRLDGTYVHGRSRKYCMHFEGEAQTAICLTDLLPNAEKTTVNALLTTLDLE